MVICDWADDHEDWTKQGNECCNNQKKTKQVISYIYIISTLQHLRVKPLFPTSLRITNYQEIYWVILEAQICYFITANTVPQSDIKNETATANSHPKWNADAGKEASAFTTSIVFNPKVQINGGIEFSPLVSAYGVNCHMETTSWNIGL